MSTPVSSTDGLVTGLTKFLGVHGVKLCLEVWNLSCVEIKNYNFNLCSPIYTLPSTAC